ncbi:hypothetical protein COJ85_17570 [Bacillus sp. AFS076308]|uniref:hypothetical protein n=1 Tax=unclassified Bacillus (in: firmicutes) TaxID=185979 RepID=UPI000BF65EAD|nr:MULTISPECIES: hypothetical protein [unclassified Bacillus (in: firmicutes)]PFO01226.1 hypothetical protein COJ85_17570 [Bacillus sp. AFS076308]PGV50055.1 hypothetical protein COD92_19530 [Bacillus sp. AFS037270]
MAKKKHNTNNTPRRKLYNRRDCLQNAKKWAEQNNGNNLAKRYSNWFGVDLYCAIIELKMLVYKFKQSYKEQVKKSLEARQKQKKKWKLDKEQVEDFGEDMFYFVAGYTENGVPFGLTREEMEEDSETSPILQSKKNKNHFNINDDDLPF